MERYPIKCCLVGSVDLLYLSVCIGNIIVHYIGDETLSVMMLHRNPNKKEPIFRTKPSVKPRSDRACNLATKTKTMAEWLQRSWQGFCKVAARSAMGLRISRGQSFEHAQKTSREGF